MLDERTKGGEVLSHVAGRAPLISQANRPLVPFRAISAQTSFGAQSQWLCLHLTKPRGNT